MNQASPHARAEQAQNRPSKSRFLRAYFLTARTLTRYALLKIISPLLGPTRMESRWERAHSLTARQVKQSIVKLRGLFIKVGQMMSIMTQFLPESITSELEGLQDSVPPAPYEDIEKRIQEELGKSPEAIFREFNPQPLASASLGQVHEAISEEGVRLAVKVQYPGIEDIVASDLKILKRIFRLLDWIFPQYNLQKTYREIREVLRDELDFQVEAQNLNLLKNNLASEPSVVFPEVFAEYSTSRVLTLKFVEGVKISQVEQLKKIHVNPTEVAEKIIHLYCKQIFIDGVYHADPHPGNFLVQAHEVEEEIHEVPPGTDPESTGEIKKIKRTVPKIVMMDFGAVARISEPMRRGIANFMGGVIKRDTQAISNAMKEMGFIAKTQKPQDEEVFDRIVEFFYERLKDVKIEEIKNLKINSMQNLEDILEFRKLDISFKQLFQSFNVPKEWALLERTLLLLMGLTTHLDPQLNPMTIIIPYAEKFVLGPERTLGDVVIETLKEVALSYLKLPSELQRTLRKLNQGNLVVATKNASATQGLKRSLNRLTYALLTVGGAFFSHQLSQNASSYAPWSWGVSGVFGVLLLGSLLRKG